MERARKSEVRGKRGLKRGRVDRRR